MTREQLAEEELNSEEGKARTASLQEQMQAKLHQYLAAGEAQAALTLHRRGRHQFRSEWKISENDHIQLISALRKTEQWNDAVELMVEYLKTPQPRASAVRLALAQVLIEKLNRPKQALKVLERIDAATLTQPQQTSLSRMQQRAEHAADEDPFEVAAEEW
jgi:hypothetical protein